MVPFQILELERENKRLSLKVEQLQEAQQKESSRCVDLESQLHEVQDETKRLKETLEMVKEHGNRQIQELQVCFLLIFPFSLEKRFLNCCIAEIMSIFFQREKQGLEELVEKLRDRETQSTDARIHKIDEDNCRLQESVQQLEAQVSRLEYEKAQLEKAHTRLQVAHDSLAESETEKQRLQTEKQDLIKVSLFACICKSFPLHRNGELKSSVSGTGNNEGIL